MLAWVVNFRLQPRRARKVPTPCLLFPPRPSASSVPLGYPFPRSVFETLLPDVYFQQLPAIKFCNSFLLITIQNGGGVYPPLQQPPPTCKHPANLHLCFQQLPGCSSRSPLPFMVLHCCRGGWRTPSARQGTPHKHFAIGGRSKDAALKGGRYMKTRGEIISPLWQQAHWPPLWQPLLWLRLLWRRLWLGNRGTSRR